MKKDKLDGIPLLVDPEEFFKHALMLREIQQSGYLNVEITNKSTLEKLKIPAALYHFILDTNTPIAEFINTILRDWCIRMYEGESKYRKGLLYKIVNCPEDILTKEQKNKLISYLHKDIPELKRRLK
jgi:hypothetical protein